MSSCSTKPSDSRRSNGSTSKKRARRPFVISCLRGSKAQGRRAPKTWRSRQQAVAILVVLLASWLSIAAGPPIWKSNHHQPIQLTLGQIQELQAIQRGPRPQSVAGVIEDRKSGAILWQWRVDDPLPMASVTKLMTVLVALETLSPDDVITVPDAAVIHDASSARMGLRTGQQVHVRTLLYGALLPSGNDAALALAIAAAGDEASFVAKMNERAQEWGLTQTHFVNPHGLDAPGHYASARDLAQLARRALANPTIAEIVATPAITIEGFKLKNTNQLLTTYPGAYGVKTGTTDHAGQVLIGAARRQEGDVLTVVLNSPNRFDETARLMDYYFRHWLWVDVGLRRDVLNRVTAPNGVTYLLYTQAAPLFIQRWQLLELRPLRIIQFEEPSLQPTGLYQVWFGDEKKVELPIHFQPLP